MEVYGMSRIHGRAPLTDNDATQGRAMNSIQTQASILAVDDDTRSLMALQGLLADMSQRSASSPDLAVTTRSDMSASSPCSAIRLLVSSSTARMLACV